MTVDINNINEDSVIYVKNKSNSDFLLVLTDRSGKSEIVPVPKTFIPIRITDFAEPLSFKRSSDFRKAIAVGILEMISEEEALKELEAPEAIAEIARLKKNNFVNPTPVQENSSFDEVAKYVISDDVSLTVKDIIIRKDINDKEKITLLTTELKSNKMSEKDLEFIIATVDKESSVYAWAFKKLYGKKPPVLKSKKKIKKKKRG